MKCKQTQELLSAYYDGMLNDDANANVDEHLGGCSECAQELAGFEMLSEMANALATPLPPAQIWSQIEQQLDHQLDDKQPIVKPNKQVRGGLFSASRLSALAATIIITVGIGWLSYHTWFGHHHHPDFTIEFEHYLEEFGRNPDAAQLVLLAKYENQPMVPDQAIKKIGYRPAVADGLPKGYTLESTYVMKMPCCDCMQSICKRSDGSTLVIFEHGGESCDDHECCLAELDNQIATTWKRGTRHITLIGVRDVSEVNQMVAWMDSKKRPVPE